MLLVFRFIIPLYIIFPPIAYSQEDSIPTPLEQQEHFLARGDSAYTQFDNETALSFYNKALTTDSTSFLSRLILSRTHYDYGLDLVAQHNHEDSRVHFEKAISHAEALVAEFPDSAQAHFMLAATMGNLAQFEENARKITLGRLVEKHSKRAIEIDSLSAYAYVSLGLYYRELTRLSWIERTMAKMLYGRLPKVSREMVFNLLQKALRIKPDFPFLHFELAMTYLMYDQPEEALNHLRILVNLQPENSQDLRNQQNATVLIDDLIER